MLTMLVEKVIVFPSEFSEYTEIIESDDLQISLIGYIGMKCPDSRNPEEFSEDDRLPSEDKLSMVMDNIRLECPDLFDERWRKGKCDLEIWVEECRKSFNGDNFDTWVLEIRNSGICRNHDAYLVSPIRQSTCKRHDARHDTIGRRVECVGEINETQSGFGNN